jgi:hypothetical protein
MEEVVDCRRLWHGGIAVRLQAGNGCLESIVIAVGVRLDIQQLCNGHASIFLRYPVGRHWLVVALNHWYQRLERFLQCIGIDPTILDLF